MGRGGGREVMVNYRISVKSRSSEQELGEGVCISVKL